MAGKYGETLLSYCTKVDLENYLLLDIDSSFDTQVDTWIATAEKYVNNYTAYTTASGLLREAITDEKVVSHIDSDSNLVVFPRKIPIVSVSALSLVKGTDSITLNLTDGDGNARYDIPTSADYIAYPDYELSVTGSSIIGSFNDIKFTRFYSKMSYIAGYGEVPYPVRQATTMIAADFIMRHTNKEDLEAISQGRVSKRWFQRRGGESDFIRDAENLLKTYRITARWI